MISLPSLGSENTDFVTRADRPHGMNIPWQQLVTCLVTEMQYETMRLGDGRSEPNMGYGLADRWLICGKVPNKLVSLPSTRQLQLFQIVSCQGCF